MTRFKQMVSLIAVALLVAAGSSNASDIKFELKRNDVPRIIGGTALTSGERPWMVSLQEYGQHFCGGSLIAPEWVLTAAHCVDGSNGQSLQVRADFVNLQDPDAGQSSTVAEIIIHPGYADNQPTDLALLRLDVPMTGINPVVLATEAFMTSYARPGASMSVSGWGVTQENGDIPNLLQTTDVPLVSKEQCNADIAYSGEISETEICAGFQRGGKDSCQGDSGGPLVMHRLGDYVQAGIVSWGEGCAIANKYGVYARVASFTDWINSVQAEEATTSTTPEILDMQSSADSDQPTIGVPFGPLRAEQGETITFEINVPVYALVLWVDIRGGSGDADLMLSFDRSPTWGDVDYAPFLDGNDEHILIETPTPGKWYVSLDGYTAYSDVELMVFTR